MHKSNSRQTHSYALAQEIWGANVFISEASFVGPQTQLELSHAVSSYYLVRMVIIYSLSAVFWVKIILVLNTILRYGHLKFFFLWTGKTPLRGLEWLLDAQT